MGKVCGRALPILQSFLLRSGMQPYIKIEILLLAGMFDFEFGLASHSPLGIDLAYDDAVRSIVLVSLRFSAILQVASTFHYTASGGSRGLRWQARATAFSKWQIGQRGIHLWLRLRHVKRLMYRRRYISRFMPKKTGYHNSGTFDEY